VTQHPCASSLNTQLNNRTWSYYSLHFRLCKASLFISYSIKFACTSIWRLFPLLKYSFGLSFELPSVVLSLEYLQVSWRSPAKYCRVHFRRLKSFHCYQGRGCHDHWIDFLLILPVKGFGEVFPMLLPGSGSERRVLEDSTTEICLESWNLSEVDTNQWLEK